MKSRGGWDGIGEGVERAKDLLWEPRRPHQGEDVQDVKRRGFHAASCVVIGGSMVSKARTPSKP